MTAATFAAWQTLSSQCKKFPKWEEYLRMFGLSDEPVKVSKQDLKREYDRALENVERIKRMHKGK